MWRLLAVFAALAAVALGSPLCEVRSFLVPMDRWVSSNGMLYYTVGRRGGRTEIEMKGVDYKHNDTIGMVFTYQGYWYENHKLVNKLCAPVDEIKSPHFKATVMELRNAGACGSERKQFNLPGKRRGKFSVTLFPQYIDECMNENEVAELTVPLYRYKSDYFGKHIYHTDPQFVKSFYGDDAKYFTFEGKMGNVLPYSAYAARKEEIDHACPDLVVLMNIFEPIRGDQRGYYDQSFYNQRDNRKWKISDELVDEGPLFVAAMRMGRCASTTAVFLTDSNRPQHNDYFYTTDEDEYNRMIKNSTYKGPENAFGKVFYIW